MVLDQEYSPITSTPGPAPPLKKNGRIKARQSLRKTITLEAGNDDDAERSSLAVLESRAGEVSTPVRSGSSDSNQSLSLTPQKEHYEGCLKLFAENKITRENAWNLRLIDYMTTMLRRGDPRMEDLQTASVLVEASAKIYGFRVDSLHHDVLLVAGGLNKAVHSKRGKKNDDDAEEEGAAAEGTALTQQKKKRKRLKGATATNPDALAGDFETNLEIDPFFEMLAATSGDVTSSNRAFNATLPIHDDTMGLVLRTDTKFLEPEQEAPAERAFTARVTLRRRLLPPFAAHHAICEPFAGFSMILWDPDAEEDSGRARVEAWCADTLDLSQQAVAFDALADPDPVPAGDTALEPHYEDDPPGGVESEEEGDVAVAACVARAAAPPPARLTDMRPGAAADARLEYSYCGIQSAWAGPAHWRLRHNRASHAAPAAASSAAQPAAPARRPARARRQPEFLGAGLAFDWRAPPAPDFEPAPPAKIMISRKTLATGTTWNEDNYKTPIDRGLDESFFRKLYSRPRVALARRRRDAPAPAEPAPPPAEPARDYDYDNENDASYCPLNIQAEDEWGAGPGEDAGPGPDGGGLLRPTQPDDLTELIEPPPKIPKVFIPFASRAKKVDMKQLKHCTWRTLTEGAAEGEAARVAPTSFFSVYGRVRRRLVGGARDALSVPLALLALLHLANERGLRLAQRADLRDVDVLGLVQ